MELRGSVESDFILRYDTSEHGLTPNRRFVFIVDEFYLSVLRLRPIEKIRSQMHKILNTKIQFPILNIKLLEHVLIRGSDSYEIDNLFSSEYHQPAHFFLCLQPETTLTSNLNKPGTNPYKFTSCGLSQFCFRYGDQKIPSSIFSSSGIHLYLFPILNLFFTEPSKYSISSCRIHARGFG